MAIIGSLPGGIVLAEGENAISLVEFKHFPALFHKTKIVLTNRRIAGEYPKTALGFIPTGSTKVSFLLCNVASTGSSSHISSGQMLFGLILTLFGLALVSENPALLLIAAVELIFIVSAFRAAIE